MTSRSCSSPTSSTVTAVCVTSRPCGGRPTAGPARRSGRRPRPHRPLLRHAGRRPSRIAPGEGAGGRRAPSGGPGRRRRGRSALASADELMAGVAAAARTVVWVADGAWRRVVANAGGREERGGRGAGGRRPAGRAGARRRPAGRSDADPAGGAGGRPARRPRSGVPSLDRLAAEVDAAAWHDRWPDGALDELVALLRQGHRAIDVLEALDQRGLLVRLLPEWAPVRSRPQRNAYHRFTVDRHLWEAAANAAALTDRVGRPGPSRARRAVPRPRQGLRRATTPRRGWSWCGRSARASASTSTTWPPRAARAAPPAPAGRRRAA